jgi:hypothetical protein
MPDPFNSHLNGKGALARPAFFACKQDEHVLLSLTLAEIASMAACWRAACKHDVPSSRRVSPDKMPSLMRCVRECVQQAQGSTTSELSVGFDVQLRKLNFGLFVAVG